MLQSYNNHSGYAQHEKYNIIMCQKLMNVVFSFALCFVDVVLVGVWRIGLFKIVSADL